MIDVDSSDMFEDFQTMVQRTTAPSSNDNIDLAVKSASVVQDVLPDHYWSDLTQALRDKVRDQAVHIENLEKQLSQLQGDSSSSKFKGLSRTSTQRSRPSIQKAGGSGSNDALHNPITNLPEGNKSGGGFLIFDIHASV